METKTFEQQTVMSRRIDELLHEVEKFSGSIKAIQHQTEMLGRENGRIERELQNTDFFINKVQPISNFTQMISVLQSITDDEDRLARIAEIQSNFFLKI